MVYNTRDFWVFGLGPSSAILKNTTFRKLDLFPSSGKGVGDTPLGQLERANFNHWTTYIQSSCWPSPAQSCLVSYPNGTQDHVFVLSRLLRALKWGLLFDERKYVITTGHSTSTVEWLLARTHSLTPPNSVTGLTSLTGQPMSVLNILFLYYFLARVSDCNTACFLVNRYTVSHK
jgi:hypothetical protein